MIVMIQNGSATIALLGGGNELKHARQEMVEQIPEQDQNICLSGTKYQDIEYTMANRGRAVFYDEHKKIDYYSALHESSNLDWTYLKNGISFVNNKTGQSLFFRRIKMNFWYVQTAAHNENADFWTANVESGTAFSVLRLFFEESAWFEAISWHLEPDLFEAYAQ